MKPLRTELVMQPASFQISHQDQLLTIGSCFAQSIGQRFLQNKFNIQANPFGTVYNPISIHRLLSYAIDNTPPTSNGFLSRDEMHLHYDFHSELTSTSKEGLLQDLRQIIEQQNRWTASCTVLMITYGTAFAYRKKSNEEIVSNCHKMPATEFEKKLLSVDEIVHSFQATWDKLKKVSPNMMAVLTVSPVRHTKDGLEQNAVSKSILRMACHELSQMKDVHYFPAFEMMMDDLRDYRFYKTDRIHPTEEAEEYIWEKFSDAFFSENTQSILNDWHEIKSALLHKPFAPTSAAYQSFLKATLAKLTQISSKIDVSAELIELKKRLHE